MSQEPTSAIHTGVLGYHGTMAVLCKEQRLKVIILLAGIIIFILKTERRVLVPLRRAPPPLRLSLKFLLFAFLLFRFLSKAADNRSPWRRKLWTSKLWTTFRVTKGRVN